MSHTTSKKPYLSIVIPLYNEEGNIDYLVEHLKDHLNNVSKTYEIILVDDGSSDGTWQKIHHLSLHTLDIKAVQLVRNFGHQHALLAGLSIANGQAVISMDGDLQHPASLIPEMLAKYEAGYSVVNTIRHDKEVAPYFKRISSTLFYKVFSFLTDIPMMSGSSDFRLLDRSVVTQLLQFQDVDIFLRGAVEWLGFHSTTIPYNMNRRHSGKSKYTLSKMFNFAKGSIVSFSTKPLKLGIWLGIVTSFLAFLEIIYIIFRFLQGETIPGWASTVGVISFLFGVLFIILGIIGTYLARIHRVLQNRPKFIISKITKED